MQVQGRFKAIGFLETSSGFLALSRWPNHPFQDRGYLACVCDRDRSYRRQCENLGQCDRANSTREWRRKRGPASEIFEQR